MSLFDRSFLITTGVTVVICGAIYYYFNSKIRDLEVALVKQNQVLSSFIANVQQEFRSRASASATGINSSASANSSAGINISAISVTETDSLASPEALNAVAELEFKKIVISDNECDSDESDDESVSDDGSDSDSVSDNEDDNKLVICDLPTSTTNDMKVIDMSSLAVTNLDKYTQEVFTPDIVSENDGDDDDSDSSDSDDDNDFQHVSKLTIDSIEVIKIENLLTTEEVDTKTVEQVKAVVQPTKEETIVYDDLKVDELRKIIVDKGLVQKEEAKKLKKNELLAVLKKTLL